MALLAVTHLTPVVGIDVHQVTGPPYPFMPHPHVGFVLDLREYLSAAEAMIGSIVFTFVQEQVSEFVESHQQEIEDLANSDVAKSAMGVAKTASDIKKGIENNQVVKTISQFKQSFSDALGGGVGRGGGGTPIFINGFMRATAGTHSFHVPGLHFPLGGTFTGLDTGKPSQDSESFMGSKTVLANGDPISFMALPALSCWFVGMAPMGHNGAHTAREYTSLPTAVMLPIPAGRPVLVGGPPVMNLMALIGGLFKASGLGCKISKAIQKAFKGNKLVKAICVSVFGEPVDARTGEVIVEQNDFTVKGRLPLVWDRYYAGHDARMGALGFGWESPADIRLGLFTHEGAVGAVACFPDSWVAFEQVPDAEGWDHRIGEGIGGHFLYWQENRLVVRTREGVEYRFAPGEGWQQAALRGTPERPLTLRLAHLNDLHGNGWIVEHADAKHTAYAHKQTPSLRYIECTGEERTGREVIFSAGSVAGCIGTVTLKDVTGQTHPLVSYEQNRVGDLIAVRDALGVPYEFAYADEHLMVRHTDRNGLSFYYSHRLHDDGVWRADHAWGDGGLYDYRFEYDTTRLETVITDSLGHVTRLQMNEEGQPVSSTDPLGGVTSYIYDDLGRTREEIGPTGLRTKWDFDDSGNLIAHTLPDHSVVRTKFDSANQAVEVIDPEGGAWQQTWDAHGKLIAQVTPSGVTACFAYDRAGQLVQVTDANQQVTTLGYDCFGNLINLTDAVGRTLRFQHDSRGNLLKRETPGEEPTAYIWDKKDRLIECELPGGRSVRCNYDPADNLIQYTDEAGQISAFTYYGQGHLASRTDPDGSITRYHYDTEEQLVGVSNPLGQQWKLNRDARGQLIEEVDYFGQSRRYGYDPAGHLSRTIDPLGQILSIQCDALGRITARCDSNRADEGEQYRYNKRGQLIEARNPCSTVARQYDTDGRLVQEAQEQGDVHGRVDYRYDPAGQLQSQMRELATVAGEACYRQTLTYDYDALGQPHTLQIDKREPIQFASDTCKLRIPPRLPFARNTAKNISQ